LGWNPKTHFTLSPDQFKPKCAGSGFLALQLDFFSSSSSSSSSVNNKSSNFSAEASLNVSDDEGVYDEDDGFVYDDEFERDDLSDFRGLVLDISYRSVSLL
jgi:hypothetical protein